MYRVCSFARLFAKLPRSGDSEVAFSVFESSYHLYVLRNAVPVTKIF